MAARLDSVCKYICENADWEVSNLRLQKLLYLAQMFHMGRNNGARLFDGYFEAWDYGPVEPDLYHRAKVFGSGRIKNIFYDARRFKESDPRRKLLDEICDRFLSYSAGDLVEITHADGGAWATHYVPKARFIRIPDEDIWREYQKRVGANRPRRVRTKSATTAS